VSVHPADLATINGHPTLELVNGDQEPVVVTVCAHCGAMRSVLWLTVDRWICNQCKTEGASRPNMYPVA
jgi:hypothetical protein